MALKYFPSVFFFAQADECKAFLFRHIVIDPKWGYVLPATKDWVDFAMHHFGVAEEMREAFRKQVIGVD